MKDEDIKKQLYKQDPIADMTKVKNGVAYYVTYLQGTSATTKVAFEIPVSDMGTADFFPRMPAKNLIRWIVGNFSEVVEDSIKND